LGNTCDRCLPTGYKDPITTLEKIKRAASIDAIEGVELVGGWAITADTAVEIERGLDAHELNCVSIIPDLFSQRRWGRGSFCARDPKIRQQAIDETLRMAEIATRL